MTDSDLRALDILESLDYAYFEADLNGVITSVNQVLLNHIGYAREEIVGHHARRITDRAHLRRLQDLFDSVYQSGQRKKGAEFDLRTKDGRVIVAGGTIALMRDAQGSPVGFRGLFHDITHRKQAEAALQDAVEAAERELEIGRQIQVGFLPDALPQPPGWEIAARFEAAREVAGDFYDAFNLSGGRRIGLVIADVCDKGVGAALFMALFRSLIRAFADQHYSLGWMDVLDDDTAGASGGTSVKRRRALLSTGTTALKNAVDLTNNYIARVHGRTSMFATVFFGVLDPATGSLMYINAGHEPPAILTPSGIKSRLEPTGPAIGLFPNLEFRIEQVTLAPGDTFVAFTDGVPDARDGGNASYSEERLLALAQQAADSAPGLLDRIMADLHAHIGRKAQYDDITLLAVRRPPRS